MIAIFILFFIIVYILISITVVIVSVTWASRRNHKPWLWGVGAGFLMYNLVFWDYIPTLVMHRYYCDTQAGFWVYKTPEQWALENPGATETLKESLRQKFDTHNWLNQRFYTDTTQTNGYFHAINKTEKKLIDAKNNFLMAHYIDFWKGTSLGVFGTGGNIDELRQALIFGWTNRSCIDEGNPPNDAFNKFSYQFWTWGQNK